MDFWISYKSCIYLSVQSSFSFLYVIRSTFAFTYSIWTKPLALKAQYSIWSVVDPIPLWDAVLCNVFMDIFKLRKPLPWIWFRARCHTYRTIVQFVFFLFFILTDTFLRGLDINKGLFSTAGPLQLRSENLWRNNGLHHSVIRMFTTLRSQPHEY